MILLGIIFVLLLELFNRERQKSNDILLKLILGSIISCILWEGNIRIDHWLNVKYPWLSKPKTRLTIQLIVTPIYTALTLKILLLAAEIVQTMETLSQRRPPPHDPIFLPALLLGFIIFLADISVQFFRAWKQSIIDAERYKTERTEAQLHVLQNQLNPHFLFNNLSVLSSLVYQNQNKAVSFISELAKVYRYVIESNNKEIILLKDEIEFINHYVYLLKIRFDNSFSCRIKIEDNLLKYYILPMSLQILVENAIQHNEASQQRPLKVNIYSSDNCLLIENNIQSRIEDKESSKLGLLNIQSRYSYITTEKVQFSRDENTFKVILPLILK